MSRNTVRCLTLLAAVLLTACPLPPEGGSGDRGLGPPAQTEPVSRLVLMAWNVEFLWDGRSP